MTHRQWPMSKKTIILAGRINNYGEAFAAQSWLSSFFRVRRVCYNYTGGYIMVRLLTLILLLLGSFEGLASVLILFIWQKVSADKAIRPVLGVLAVAFLYLSYWNFGRNNYFLSAVASTCFMVALIALMVKPLIETWGICNS
jgi:hypothetical protein